MWDFINDFTDQHCTGLHEEAIQKRFMKYYHMKVLILTAKIFEIKSFLQYSKVNFLYAILFSKFFIKFEFVTFYETALLWAAYDGHTETVREILQHEGVDVNIRDI